MFTYDETYQTLKDVVQEAGEGYVYPDDERVNVDDISPVCSYTHNGKPSCIVGRAVRKLIPDAGFVEGAGPSGQEWTNDFDEDSLALLASSQGAQDVGVPWGQALDYGVKEVKENHV